ncbi:glycosyl hydrolase family 88 [Nonlabens dokdonensis]|uniref:Unsaturated glucuronyl hydrolase n=2 Tax=Nonlabens dokdonensis TaxID=328515 RepID=L7W1U7_NONDD|nr:glycoside hydrolase family 88 protein [Nonlabens dokdonensis]AGC75460.1 unsaturated glucuronyl hydrolase [Nonlabens dokdonensis DSW-6]PZX43156.1 glycosyl hydrolase family 88 [Nonlabens dokdonensis]
MKTIYNFGWLLTCMILLASCKPQEKEVDSSSATNIDLLLKARYEKLLRYPIESAAFPRSYNPDTKQILQRPSKDWTSGFYAGNLWMLSDVTGESRFRESAQKWTAFIEKEKYNDGTHDMGFKVYNSFGLGYNRTKNEEYKSILLKSAQTLATRFNPNVQSIRSWDFRRDQWEFPVIIDNMMNLELLFEATRLSGDSTFHKLAVTHANTTLKNHFRKDDSTVHVVVYDTISGEVKDRVTHQGYSDDSAWARGQGWAIYGYTMAYRYTNDKRYLEQAEATANFFINHKNMREDGIPYWDFDAPNIPNEPRDVSAAAIVASALVELYGYTKDEQYINYSKQVLNSLKSEEYILPADLDIPFILAHSSGDWSKRSEMDEPIIYGDYYFLELMLRLEEFNQ